MVEKRLAKLREIKKEIIPPTFIGQKTYELLLISWGSNFHIVNEAVQKYNSKDIAMLHFTQIYPISANVFDYFNQAKNTLCIENNATGQFQRLLTRELNITPPQKLLKYDGLPFSVENIYEKITTLMEGS
jgi:2-oxoglutarate ferredoxin oxidoreductase subunit alpha